MVWGNYLFENITAQTALEPEWRLLCSTYVWIYDLQSALTRLVKSNHVNHVTLTSSDRARIQDIQRLIRAGEMDFGSPGRLSEIGRYYPWRPVISVGSGPSSSIGCGTTLTASLGSLLNYSKWGLIFVAMTPLHIYMRCQGQWSVYCGY